MQSAFRKVLHLLIYYLAGDLELTLRVNNISRKLKYYWQTIIIDKLVVFDLMVR